jgi:hypothetical protein
MKFHMWKDFTWNYKWNFTCERISNEIINYNEISHVKGFHIWNYKLQWNFTCERILHEITSEISHVKGFHMKLKITSEISHEKGFYMK